MRPEDVPLAYVEAAHKAWNARRSPFSEELLRHALAAVLPLAVAEERAECAKVAMEYPVAEDEHVVSAHGRVMQSLAIATAIRSRGEPR